MAADRRYGAPIPTRYLGTKLCSLHTHDSHGFIGYAGTGARVPASSAPFELSEWIKRTLRGLDVSLDEALERLAAEATKSNLDRLAGPEHTFVYAGHLRNEPIVEYVTSAPSIFSTDYKTREVCRVHLAATRFARHRFVLQSDGILTARLGSGAYYVDLRSFKGIQKYVRQSGSSEGRLQYVEQRLAKLIEATSRRTQTVGPESICAWRVKGRGGAHSEFDAKAHRVPTTTIIPSLVQGAPSDDISRAVMPTMAAYMTAVHEAKKEGKSLPLLDMNALNLALAAVREDPDSTFG